MSAYLDRARQLIADWKKAPPPMGGAVDTDGDLLRRIAKALEETAVTAGAAGLAQGEANERQRVEDERKAIQREADERQYQARLAEQAAKNERLMAEQAAVIADPSQRFSD